VKLPDGSLLISSWAASAVLRGTPGGTFEPVINEVKSPADIGYDAKRNTVLIPQFMANTVVLQKLPGGAPVASLSVTPGPVATAGTPKGSGHAEAAFPVPSATPTAAGGPKPVTTDAPKAAAPPVATLPKPVATPPVAPKK